MGKFSRGLVLWLVFGKNTVLDIVKAAATSHCCRLVQGYEIATPYGVVYEPFSRQPCHDHPEADASLLNEILLGLTSEKKTLPSKLLYDATGSELFQRITELPEYYLTRTERKLLRASAADIVASVPVEAGRGRALVEFGASDESKAVSLLDVAESHFSSLSCN